jgi:hypothetical protein
MESVNHPNYPDCFLPAWSLVLLLLLLSCPLAMAAETLTGTEGSCTLNHDKSRPASTNQKSPWSIETSLSFPPAARIYMLKASYQVSGRSELGFGPAFQNWKNDDKIPRGQANAYTLLLSYRYFFWKNFHLELELWPAYNHFNSFVDGKTYKGLELWVEYKLGYKANLSDKLYLYLQPGLAHGLWMQNKWPGFNEYSTMDLIKKSLVPVPQILLGWTF